MVRFFDILLSLIGLIILSPVIIIVSLIILFTSGFPVFFVQTRVGKNNKDFRIIKFRTMEIGAEKKGGITIGSNDNRITPIGDYLRRLKIDEFPQLFNVLIGEMSFVGPRPELRKYVDLYKSEDMDVLSVRPGITDWASIHFIKINNLMGKSDNPEEYYLNFILPKKRDYNRIFINNYNLFEYFKIIFATIRVIIKYYK